MKLRAADIGIFQNLGKRAVVVAREGIQHPVGGSKLEWIRVHKRYEFARTAASVTELEESIRTQVVLQAQIVLRDVGCAQVRIDDVESTGSSEREKARCVEVD